MPVSVPPGLQGPAVAPGEKAIKAASASLHTAAVALTKGSEMRQAQSLPEARLLLQYANEGRSL